MKIFAIGLNYSEHIKEFGSQRPEEPIVFFKPETALLRGNKPFYLPPFSDQVEYETELVVRINRLGKNIVPKFAHRYYDSVALGIDFTARDLQLKAKGSGLPWALSKGFDGAAVLSEWIPLSETPGIQSIDFRLDLNGATVQQGHTADMLFAVDELIAYISRFVSLKMGDIIYTGTPVGVGPVVVNDHLQGYISDRLMFDFMVK